MQGNGQEKIKFSGCIRLQVKIVIFDGIITTGSKAITAKRTGESRIPVTDILNIQRIIFAKACTFHAQITGIINVHSEGI